MFLREFNKQKLVDSLDKIIKTDENHYDMKLEDILSDDIDFTENCENKEIYIAIRELVEQLPNRDKEIIKLYFGFDNNRRYKQSEIADKMSLTQSYISRIILRILQKIGIKLEQEGFIELRHKKIKTSNTKSRQKQKTLF